MYSLRYFLPIFVLCFGCVLSKKIPSYIELCKRNDPQLNDCIKRAIEAIRPHLKDSVPELGLPSTNPLILPEASLDTGKNFKASFKNIEIYYADEFELQNIVVDLDRNHLEISVKFPRLRIKSIYNVDGKILVLTLNGNGPADGNFTDVTAHVVYDGTRTNKNGKEYIVIGDGTMELNIGKPHFQFDNIFKDNAELNEQTNKIINENVEDFIEELLPVVRSVISQFVNGIVSRIFSKYSFDELFPL